MNITIYQRSRSVKCACAICPDCHWQNCPSHDVYVRKGFHRVNVCGDLVLITVPRFRCLNPHCPRRTFSTLPPRVIRYCRFFWPHLLCIQHHLSSGVRMHQIARSIFKVSWAVIKRAASLLQQMLTWVQQLYQEITDGQAVLPLSQMLTIILKKIDRFDLMHRWYCRKYPRRVCMRMQLSHN